MPFNNVTSRTDVETLIPEEVSRDMLGAATEQSVVLDLFRPIPVAATQVRFPILSALPTAYWVNGDTGVKQTTEMAWSQKFLNVEELATILPVPENVVEDINFNIWDTSRPYIIEAFGRALDAAVFFGVNAPSSFPLNVLAASTAAGNTVNESTAAVATGGYYGVIDEALANVEEDGHDVAGWVADLSIKRKFRSARQASGAKLDEGRLPGDLSSIDGTPIRYGMKGMWPAGVRALAGDWNSQFIVGVRSDIEFKFLDQAVITDNSSPPNIIFNLPQQDMVAMRVKFRVGWQVANTFNSQRPAEAQRYPAAAIVY